MLADIKVTSWLKEMMRVVSSLWVLDQLCGFRGLFRSAHDDGAGASWDWSFCDAFSVSNTQVRT